MRVYVAGATGVLGRSVVRELIARGHTVTGLARSRENEALLRELGAVPAPGDLFDADSLARGAAAAEVVMHLASAVPTRTRQTLRDWQMNDRIRIEGTANLIDAARRAQARFYVQQSVTFVHGGAGVSWVDEESLLIPHRVDDSAVTMERLVREAGELYGLRAAIMRGGLFYHPEARHTRRMIRGLRFGRLPVVGMGANFWSLIHVDDMAHACVLAAEQQPAGQTLLVVDDAPVRYRDLFTYIARETGGPKPRYLPPVVARLLVGGLTFERLTASLRCRNNKLKRQLGWEPRFPTYEDGFAAILAGRKSRFTAETQRAQSGRGAG
jgi:2-alkyl-3-oxoalkanoate reductase